VSHPERPVPPPLEGNDRLITAVITAGFVVALIVLLIVHDTLPAADRWWIWVAGSGSVLGFFGLAYVPHLKRARERAAERRRAAAGYHGATDITAPPARPAGDTNAGNTNADVTNAPPR
jgi:uncharacterized membrane protein